MNPPRVEYPELMDFEWFATDGIGQIARFTSAGMGPIPAIVLESAEMLDRAYDEVENLLRIGAAVLHVELPKPDDFEKLSSSGLYGYDWYDIHRHATDQRDTYDLLSSPTKPRLIGELRDHLRNAALLVAMPHIVFGRDVVIRDEARIWRRP